MRAEFLFEDIVAGRQVCFDIAALNMILTRDVRSLFFVDERRILLQRLDWVVYDWQKLIFDLYKLQRFLCYLVVLRGDRRHLVTDIAHLVDCQHIDIGNLHSKLVMRAVLRRYDRLYPRQRLGGRRIDRQYFCVRMRRTQDFPCQKPGKLHIVEIFCRPRHLLIGVHKTLFQAYTFKLFHSEPSETL